MLDTLEPFRLLHREYISATTRVLVSNFHRAAELASPELVDLDKLLLEASGLLLIRGRGQAVPNRQLWVNLTFGMRMGVGSLTVYSGKQAWTGCAEGRQVLAHTTLTGGIERVERLSGDEFRGRICGGRRC